MSDHEMPGWSVETLHDDFRLCLREDRVLYDSRSDHQRLKVFENPSFGRVLTLDGIVQTTSGDEFIYHEMMAHVPLFAHGAARDVLIIGGGDGGMAREVLRHASVQRLVQVEIDADVISFSREHLPMLSAGAFDDPRFELVISDGATFVAETERRFDVIIVDSTDPVGPGAALFEAEFYANARRCLTEGGILVTQSGVPFLQGDDLKASMTALGGLFRDAVFYLIAVPTYAGGPMAIGWATDGDHRDVDPDVLSARVGSSGLRFQYYSAEVHKAAFAVPEYLRRIAFG